MSALRVSVLGWSAGIPGERIGCQLDFGEDGRLSAVRRTSGEQMAAAFGPVDAVIDGRHVVPTQLRAEISDDEVEGWAELGPLRLRVRHNLDRTWQVRVQLTNPTDEPIAIERLGWEVTPGADARVMVLAAGALATVAFCQVRGPVVALRLSRGDLIVDDEGLACPPLVLAAGGSYAVTLQGEWYASADAVWATLPPWFPTTHLDELSAEDFAIDHPDAAVTWVGERSAGVRRVTVAEARGTIRLDLAVAPRAEEEVARLVRAVAEHGKVANAAEAVVVAIGSTAQVDGRCEALLEAYADRTPDPPTALQVCLWARLATLGWPAMVDRALATADQLQAGPGTGLAAVALWTAASLEGRDPQGLGGRLGRLSRADPSPADPVTLVELGALAGRSDDVMARAQWEVKCICHAPPAQAWPQRSDPELARAVALRVLAKDPCPALSAHLLARCADRDDPRDNAAVLAWLGFADA